MRLLNSPRNILILGGGDGCAARELLKYPNIQQITLVDLDKKLTNLFIEEEELAAINNYSLTNPKLKIINQDGFSFINKTQKFFDLIIIDLPDPRNVELSRLYSKEFYQLCYLRLTSEGGLITQAGSPYYTPEAYQCINHTMSSAGFSTLPLHNQILSMGEWGWIAGTKKQMNKKALLTILERTNFNALKTQWLNNESIKLITSFGKDFYRSKNIDSIKVNQISNPILYRYYNKGNWDTY